MVKFWPGGWKTARRVAKRPPTGKPKLSRVTSGYGGLKIPLGRIRLTPKNGGYMGENGDFRAGGHWEKLRSSETKRATTDRLVPKRPQFRWLRSRKFWFLRFLRFLTFFLRFLTFFLRFFTFFIRFFTFFYVFYVFFLRFLNIIFLLFLTFF